MTAETTQPAAGTAAKSRRDSHSSSPPFFLPLCAFFPSLQLICGLMETLQVTPFIFFPLPFAPLEKKQNCRERIRQVQQKEKHCKYRHFIK